MLSLLKRYSWKQFSIVTSTVAGYREFIQAVSEAAYKFESHNIYKFKILGTVQVNNNASNLGSLLGTEARILLLYSTREEARSILKTAGQMGLTGDKYVWIVTQSVIGSTTESPPEFPVGMLDDGQPADQEHINCSQSFVNGVEGFHRELNASTLLSPKVSCEDSTSTSSRWAQGEQLFNAINTEDNQTSLIKVYRIIPCLSVAPTTAMALLSSYEPAGSLLLYWAIEKERVKFPEMDE
ncbi:hypothetical protein DAPPUDRAFT_246687 [Daphnia pulex]|uniref:Receptor ligand binding region domain-containing protein n=1 Tax=Daphnia pulex TaxID=6669 RepID=E9GR22_DAPPU|nr:hypothetical protein DAPPUDRAFT_246687 [Daphnia pulex]|eukprot:EFX77933.1 hypothetical protein DAPPUDRAFT_246687 [Daphnia pulex]